MGTPKEQLQFVKKLVKSYHFRKEENRLAISESGIIHLNLEPLMA